MIRAVLFDLDGTLLDRVASLEAFVTRQWWRIACLQAAPLEAFVARFVALDDRGRVWKDVVYQRLIAEFHLYGCRWEALLADYEGRFASSAIPFPHLRSTLETLRSGGMKLGLISNGRTAFQWTVIHGLDIASYFDAVLISEEEGVRKPDPEIFHRGLKRLSVAPHEAVYVGDHPEADVRGAQGAGMRAVWKHCPFWGEPAGADGILGSLDALPGLVQQLASSAAEPMAAADEAPGL